MSTLWRLRVEGPMAVLRTAADRLTEAPDAPALAWSVFERDRPEDAYLEVLFGGRIDEDAFRAAWGLDGSDLTAMFAPLPEEDWVALSLQGLPSIQAGRFLVFGDHTREDLKPGLIGLEIEAGPAFGTGHHGTTLGCLKAIDALEADGVTPARVLDLGTGTGLLAIAARKLWPDADVLATDIDAVSVEETVENARKNACTFETAVADGFDHPAFEGRRFDLVLANILAGPLVQLAPDICARLEPGGRVVLSGLLEEQIAMVQPAYEAQGLRLHASGVIEGWACLVMGR